MRRKRVSHNMLASLQKVILKTRCDIYTYMSYNCFSRLFHMKLCKENFPSRENPQFSFYIDIKLIISSLLSIVKIIIRDTRNKKCCQNFLKFRKGELNFASCNTKKWER